MDSFMTPMTSHETELFWPNKNTDKHYKTQPQHDERKLNGYMSKLAGQERNAAETNVLQSNDRSGLTAEYTKQTRAKKDF